MADVKDELTDADLKAFDLLLSHLEETGQTTLSRDEVVLTTPAILVTARFAIQFAVKFAARTAICVAPAEKLPEGMDEIGYLGQLKPEISLDELKALRESLR